MTRYLTPSLATILLLASHPSYLLAQSSIDCPKTLATIEQGPVSALVEQTVKALYQELGCGVIYVPMPGRRGILKFNQYKVDGEVMRQPKAESLYTRGFVRSSQPMFTIRSSLWRHPERSDMTDKRVGYNLGIVWQEKYVKDKAGVPFRNSEHMIRAYNSKRIPNFLLADYSARQLTEEGKLQPPPIRISAADKAPIYHYLDKRFAPFMKRFSSLLEQRDPFSYMDELQR